MRGLATIMTDPRSGPLLSQLIQTEAARALRATAAQIEEGKLDTGFHPVRTPSGEKIGEVDVDYYGIAR